MNKILFKRLKINNIKMFFNLKLQIESKVLLFLAIFSIFLCKNSKVNAHTNYQNYNKADSINLTSFLSREKHFPKKSYKNVFVSDKLNKENEYFKSGHKNNVDITCKPLKTNTTLLFSFGSSGCEGLKRIIESYYDKTPSKFINKSFLKKQTDWINNLHTKTAFKRSDPLILVSELAFLITNEKKIVLYTRGKIIENIKILSFSNKGNLIEKDLFDFSHKNRLTSPLSLTVGDRYDEDRFNKFRDELWEIKKVKHLYSYIQPGKNYKSVKLLIILVPNTKTEIKARSWLEQQEENNRLSQRGKYEEVLGAIERTFKYIEYFNNNEISSHKIDIKRYLDHLEEEYMVHTSIHGNIPTSDRIVINALMDNANLYQRISRFRESIKFYWKAIKRIQNDTNDRLWISAVNAEIASIYSKIGQLSIARKIYVDTIRLLENINKAPSKSTELIPRKLPNDDEPYKHFRDLCNVTKKLHICYQYQVRKSIVNRNIEHAIEITKDFIAKFRNQKKFSLEAELTTNLVILYTMIGDIEKAQSYFDDSIEKWKLSNFKSKTYFLFQLREFIKPDEVKIFLGELYRRIGKKDKSLENIKESLLFNVSTPPNHKDIEKLFLLAENYREIGEYKKSIKYFDHILTILEGLSTDSTTQKAIVKLLIAQNYSILNNKLLAIELINDSLNEIEIQENPYFHSLGNFLLTSMYFSKKLDNKAKISLQKAKNLSNISGNKTFFLEILALEGIMYENHNNLFLAKQSYLNAINEAESIRKNSSLPDINIGYFSNVYFIYDRLANILWNEKKYNDVFNLVGKVKARSFIDKIVIRNSKLNKSSNKSMSSGLAFFDPILGEIRTKILSFERELTGEKNNNEILKLYNELYDREFKFHQSIIGNSVLNVDFSEFSSAETLNIVEVQSLLDNNSTLVEYFVSGNNVFVFIVNKEKISQLKLNVPYSKIKNEIDLFLDFPSLDNPSPKALVNLHNFLFKPIEQYLHKEKIIIIPHKKLHQLPFTALNDGNSYLIDKFNISTFPSATSLQYVPKKTLPKNPSILAIGDAYDSQRKPLSFARKEIEFISRIFNIKPFLGKKATETSFYKNLMQKDIIHLALHGSINQSNPIYSTLFFSEDSSTDGRLEFHEISNLNLAKTKLIVLSACETRTGKIIDGDEITAINRAFFQAGVSTVISTYWTVDDAASFLFMKQFYENLRLGYSISRSFQKSMKYLKSIPKYSHPYYWSTFSLSGHF